jgi:hypothetical protein
MHDQLSIWNALKRGPASPFGNLPEPLGQLRSKLTGETVTPLAVLLGQTVTLWAPDMLGWLL